MKIKVTDCSFHASCIADLHPSSGIYILKVQQLTLGSVGFMPSLSRVTAGQNFAADIEGGICLEFSDEVSIALEECVNPVKKVGYVFYKPAISLCDAAHVL